MRSYSFLSRLDVRMSMLIAAIVITWCLSFIMVFRKAEIERINTSIEVEMGKIDTDVHSQYGKILNDILLEHTTALNLSLEKLLRTHHLNWVELQTYRGKTYLEGSKVNGIKNLYTGEYVITYGGYEYGKLNYGKEIIIFVKTNYVSKYWMYISIAVMLVVFYLIRFFIGKQVIEPIKFMIKECGDGSKKNIFTNVDDKRFLALEIKQLVDYFGDMRMLLNEHIRQQIQNENLIAIGESTAMVAHDVRKPLASMKALLTALPVIKDNPAEVARLIASVDRNISQTNAMLNDILEFSKDASSLKSGDENPQGIITAALTDALRNHIGSEIRINYSFGHQHLLHVDGARIIRVITNIIDNALDAMTPEGGLSKGEINIETSEIILPANDQSQSRGMFRISISDSGPGIPDDVLPTIFNPFVTKGKRGGTGLGLAICHRVVNMHGGKIEAKNSPHGAEFIIDLPMSNAASTINEDELIHNSQELEIFRIEEAARPEYGDSANTAEFMLINKERGRKSYLLIVDDEPLFRESVRCLLSDIPQVRDHVKFIEVGSAESALEIMSKQEFDYVISDIDLGKRRMNGYAFSKQVLELYSGVRVVIHSNKRREEMDKGMRQIKNDRFMGFLPKPMTQSELLQFLACKTFESTASHVAELKPKKNVLVVNDDDCLLVSLKSMLKSDSVHVSTCTNMGDALRHIDGNKIDLVLSDINLGEGEPNGYDLLKSMIAAGSKIPFYFISGYSSSEEEPKAKEHGAAGYFQLPVEEETLMKLLV